MKFPCEIVVRDFLPTMRAFIAKELIKSHGFTQNEVASVLGITQASVNYYLNAKRGGKTKFPKELKALRPFAKKVAGQLAQNKTQMANAIQEFCITCVNLRAKRSICSEHKKVLLPLRGQTCDICAIVECI